MDELEKETEYTEDPVKTEVRKSKENTKKKKKKKRRKKRMPIGWVIVLDLLAIGLGLIIFALFHHVLYAYNILVEPGSTQGEQVGTLSSEPADTPVPTEFSEQTPPPEESAEPEPTPEPTPARVYSGMWGEKFADQFTEGEVIQTEDSYKSENVSITLTRVEKPRLIYYVADIYISDLKYFGTAFASGEGNGEYNTGTEVQIDKIANRVNAVVAINGDHYKLHQGIVVRNGVLYRETTNEDICVLYTDGRMETMMKDEVDMETLKTAGVWQVWSFGPGLLDAEGHAKTFTNNQANALGVNVENPRCAIGYYEPGHYCFVKVEGNRWGKFIGSYGLTFTDMAKLFEEFGCVSAYNLDGGRSTAMSWQGEFLSTNYDRGSFDIIYIADTSVVAEVPKAAEEAAGSEG